MATRTLAQSLNFRSQCHKVARSQGWQNTRECSQKPRAFTLATQSTSARDGSSLRARRQLDIYHRRHFQTTTTARLPPAAPKSRDRGPVSEEDTQTDFTTMDMLSNTPVPTTSVDACMEDGFALDSGLKVTGSGVLLVGGEAFRWRPWAAAAGASAQTAEENRASSIYNAKRQFDVDAAVWGVLEVVWPKPDLLVVGTGRSLAPLSPRTRAAVNRLGIRLEVQDTRNAAAQFNLLATERGVNQVAAALVPIGWRDPRSR